MFVPNSRNFSFAGKLPTNVRFLILDCLFDEELCSLVRNEVRVDRSLHCGPSTQSCVVISFFFIRQDVLFEDPCTQKHIRERERERERERSAMVGDMLV